MEKISRVHHEALKLQHHVFLYKPKLGQEQLEFQRAIQRIQVLNQQLSRLATNQVLSLKKEHL